MGVDVSMAKAERDMEKTRAEAKKPVKTQLELDVEEAENRVRALRIREEAKKLKIHVDVDADTTKAKLQLQLLRAQAEARKITVRMDADTSPIRSALSKLFGGGGGGRGGSGGGGGSFFFGPIGLPLIFTGIGELPAATTAIANVAGAIQQLSGAGGALPGVFAGVVSEVAVVKLATMGVSDAFSALDKASQSAGKSVKEQNKALDEAQAALTNLAPQTADFVRQVYGLKPAFDELQKGVSGKFFDGLGKSVKDLADNDLPVLNKGLGGISTALNGSLKQLGLSLSSDSSKGLLDRIFGNTADAQTRLTAAIDPLIKGVGTLAAAGSDVLPRLADDIGKAAQRFSAFISEADKNGTLDKFINNGITGVENLGSTFVNVGKILNDITGAAGGGGGLLKFLDEGSAKLHAFLSSTEGQNQLKKWFEEGRREIQEHIIPLLQALPGFFEGLYAAGRTIADTVVPPLRDIAHFLGEHPDLIKAAAEALVAFKVGSGVLKLVGALGKISGLLDEIPGKAATAGGALGNKLALGAAGLTLALGGALTQPTDGKSGPNGVAALSTIGGGALAGFQIAGPIGAAFGTLAGAAVTLTEVFINQANQMKALQQKRDDDLKHQPKGSPAVVAPPPGAGQPGTAVAPAPSIVKPSTTGGLPGLLVPQVLNGSQVGPFGTGTPVSVPPTQSNLGSGALSEVADAARQATSEVGQLSDGINHLPKGEVNIQNNTPQVIEALKTLGYAVQQLPNGHLQIQVEYKDPLGLLTTGGLGHGVGLSTSDGRPILAPGHAKGGVLPGYSPGKDNMLVPLAGGEGIIRPEVVRKVGPGFIHALNSGGMVPSAVPWGVDPRGGKNQESVATPFAPWWDMDWMPSEHPERISPGPGKWWSRGPTPGARDHQEGHFAPPIGKLRKAGPGDPYWGFMPDWRIKSWGFATGGVVGNRAGSSWQDWLRQQSALGDAHNDLSIFNDRKAALPPSGSTSEGIYLNKDGTPYNHVPDGVQIVPQTGASSTIRSSAADPQWFLNQGHGLGTYAPIISNDKGIRNWREWTSTPPGTGGQYNLPGGGIGAYHPGKTLNAARGGAVPQHFGTGGDVIDQFGNPVNAGPTPGPIAPNPTDGGGISGIANSFLGGLGGVFSNIQGLAGNIPGATAGSSGTGAKLTPGLAGLFQAGSDQNLLGQWGQQTGDWLGNFAAKTLTSFGSALWQGGLDFFGLGSSILSPSNPWFQDAAKSAGFFLGQNGPLGSSSGTTGSGSSGKVTDKQLRSGQNKVIDTHNRLTVAQQRLAELQPDAKQSQRTSAQNAVDKAQREADQADTDFGSLQNGVSPSSTTSASPGGGNQGIVYQAMIDAGFPESEWPALQNILNHESGFKATAKNPSSTAFGMFQFLDSTWASVGGTKTTDPGLQAQYGLQYIRQRYGSPSAAWAFWQANNWYAGGGDVPGSGRGDTVPAMLTPGEHVLTTSDVAALGGQKGVYALREAIHMAVGGAVPTGLAVRPLPPLPRPPDARTIQPRPVAPPSRPSVPTAPSTPALPDAPLPAQAAPNQDQQPAFVSPTPTGGASPTTKSHTLPAISTGVTSGFATAGSIAQTAAAIGSFGAAGGLGGALAGGGGGGPSIAGLFQQFGKIANDVIDVGSAFLVGNVTPGTEASQYGTTNRPAQNVPHTAPLDSGRTYIFNDTHSARVVDELRVKDAQDRQAALAQWGG